MLTTAVEGRAATGYEDDFSRWAQEQAQLLRERRFSDLDLPNLIEEVESVGRSDKREIRSRLAVLLAHLLKWKYQPGARTRSWNATINEQRNRVAGLIHDSPSLAAWPVAAFDDAYRSARLQASEETGIDFTLFPEEPQFSLSQVLDRDFLPKEPDLIDRG